MSPGFYFIAQSPMRRDTSTEARPWGALHEDRLEDANHSSSVCRSRDAYAIFPLPIADIFLRECRAANLWKIMGKTYGKVLPTARKSYKVKHSSISFVEIF